MTLKEIPQGQWRDFLDQFSRVHHDSPARLESTIDENPEPRLASELPLLGVTEEHSGDRDRITIMLGRASGAHLSHTIDKPVTVRAAEWNDGYSGCLEIDSADGSHTKVQVGPLSQTLPAEMITDGVI